MQTFGVGIESLTKVLAASSIIEFIMTRLPRSLDPFQMRALQQDWEDVLRPDDLPRLAQIAVQADSIAATVRLGLYRGSLNEVRLRGRIAGSVDLVCQRCLEKMPWTFELVPDVVVVASGMRTEAFGEGTELLELEEDGLLFPLQWIEEEILLALPLAPRHEECAYLREPREFVDGAGADEAGGPFAILEALRGKS
jgi:uncharacterized protein